MKGIQSNGFLPIIAQAIAEMEETHGEFSSIDEVNLAELDRRTGLSRSKLRRLKRNGFCEKLHGLKGQKKEHILDGYSSVLDALSQQFKSLPGETSSNRVYWQSKYSETVYRHPQTPYSGQTPVGCTAGKPWPTVRYKAR